MSMEILPPWETLGYFDTPTTSPVGLTNGVAKQLITLDPRRVVVAFQLSAGTNVTFAFNPTDAANGRGFFLANNTTFLLFNNHDHGPLTQVEWWGFTTTIGVTVQIVEVKLLVWPQPQRRYRHAIPPSPQSNGGNGNDNWRATGRFSPFPPQTDNLGPQS